MGTAVAVARKGVGRDSVTGTLVECREGVAKGLVTGFPIVSPVLQRPVVQAASDLQREYQGHIEFLRTLGAPWIQYQELDMAPTRHRRRS